MAAGRKLEGLEVGRGVAAVFVVLTHAGAMVAEPRFYSANGLADKLAPFGAGVDFFFVLSGFIITWVHGADIGRPEKLSVYLGRRFVRVYPPYWIILFPLFVSYVLTPGSGHPSQHSPVNLVFSALLLPYVDPPILGVAWTLVREVIFYAVFSVFIIFGRRALYLLPVWAVMIFAQNVFDFLPYPTSIVLDISFLEFMLGMVAAYVVRRGVVPFARTLTIGGWTLFFVLLAVPPGFMAPDLNHLAFGAAAAIGIVGTCTWERLSGFGLPRWFVMLGACSYAIYLIHPIILSAVVHLSKLRILTPMPVVLVLSCAVAASVVAGFTYHVYIERPLLRWLQQLTRQHAPSQAIP